MASSESVLNELTSLEKETRLARERFQKTLDDIADDNNISRSPRIKKSKNINFQATPGNEVTDDDVNSLLARLDHLGSSSSSNTLFSPLVTTTKSKLSHDSTSNFTRQSKQNQEDTLLQRARAAPIQQQQQQQQQSPPTQLAASNATHTDEIDSMLAKVGSSWSSTPTSLSNIKSKSSTTTKKEDDETNLDLERERDWLQREIAREENRMRQLKAKRAGVTIADTATSAATAAASSSSSPNAEHETDDFLQRWRARDMENKISLSFKDAPGIEKAYKSSPKSKSPQSKSPQSKSPQSTSPQSKSSRSVSPRSDRSSEVLAKAEAAMARAEQAMLSFNERGLDDDDDDVDLQDNYDLEQEDDSELVQLEQADLAGRYREMSNRDRYDDDQNEEQDHLYQDREHFENEDLYQAYYNDEGEEEEYYIDDNGNEYYEQYETVPSTLPTRNYTTSPIKNNRQPTSNDKTLRTSRSLFAGRVAPKNTNSSFSSNATSKGSDNSHRATRSLFAKNKNSMDSNNVKHSIDPRDELIASLEKTQELQRLKLKAITAERKMLGRKKVEKKISNDSTKRRRRRPRRRRRDRREEEEEMYSEDEYGEDSEDGDPYDEYDVPRRRRRRRREVDSENSETKNENKSNLQTSSTSSSSTMNISRKQSIGGYKTLDQFLKHVDTKSNDIDPTTSSIESTETQKHPPTRSTNVKEELLSYKHQAVALEKKRKRQMEAKRTRELQDLRRKASAKARRLDQEKKSANTIQRAWRSCLARKILFTRKERRRKVEVEAAKRRWESSQEYQATTQMIQQQQQQMNIPSVGSRNTMTVTMAAQGFTMVPNNKNTFPPSPLAAPILLPPPPSQQQQQQPQNTTTTATTLLSPPPHHTSNSPHSNTFRSPQPFTGMQQQQQQHQQLSPPQQRKRSLELLTALVLSFRVRLFMQSPKITTLLKQIRDTDEMLQSMSNDDMLRAPLTKQLRGTKAQLIDLFVPSQRKGNGYRPSFGQVFAEEMGRVRRAKASMAAASASTASSSSSGGGGERAVSKKSQKRGMSARERTKKYNNELKQRRKQNGTNGSKDSLSITVPDDNASSSSTTSTRNKRMDGPKPWQTPRNKKALNKKVMSTISMEENGSGSGTDSIDSSATTSSNGASNRDRAWFEEGGFNLTPVATSNEATAIVFQVLAARDLYGVPRAPDPDPGPRDPFVSIEMLVHVPGVGERALHQKSSVKTSVKKSTLNPKWEQDVGLALSMNEEMKRSTKIVIRVEDNDRFAKQSFLGCVVLTLDQFDEETAVGAKWYELVRHSDHGKSQVRGQIRLRMKLVSHNSKVDKEIARGRRLKNSKSSKTTTKTAPSSNYNDRRTSPSPKPMETIQVTGKSTRKTKRQKRPPQKKIVHHKTDYSHVKSKTSTRHDRSTEHLSRHEQLQEAQREYRRDRHHPNEHNSIISESNFPVVTHSIDLSERDARSGNNQHNSNNANSSRDEEYEESYNYSNEYNGNNNSGGYQEEWQGYDEDGYSNRNDNGQSPDQNEFDRLERQGEKEGLKQHDMETLMKLYYQGGDDSSNVLPEGRLGFNDLMELQSELESRDGFHDGNGSSFAATARGGGGGGRENGRENTILPQVLPQTLAAQDDDEAYEAHIASLERQYQRLGGAST